jgi:hypothetical protein
MMNADLTYLRLFFRVGHVESLENHLSSFLKTVNNLPQPFVLKPSFDASGSLKKSELFYTKSLRNKFVNKTIEGEVLVHSARATLYSELSVDSVGLGFPAEILPKDLFQLVLKLVNLFADGFPLIRCTIDRSDFIKSTADDIRQIQRERFPRFPNYGTTFGVPWLSPCAFYSESLCSESFGISLNELAERISPHIYKCDVQASGLLYQAFLHFPNVDDLHSLNRSLRPLIGGVGLYTA